MPTLINGEKTQTCATTLVPKGRRLPTGSKMHRAYAMKKQMSMNTTDGEVASQFRVLAMAICKCLCALHATFDTKVAA